VDLGDWSIRNWRPLAGLTSALLIGLGALAGSLTGYNSYLPALGGPNGLLYDVTLKVAQPWRRNIPTAPVVFVAIDDASLSDPELAALPRALFQPVWARLIDGLLEAGARRIAFDVVFAYAGADFQVGAFTLPDYDRSLIDSLERARDRIVLGRFPSVSPALPFLKAAGASRVGVLDLQLESDGRVRSTAPIIRLADGRIALGFAALGAGLSVRQASATQRILMTPYAPMTDTPIYSLATLLACLSSAEGAALVRRFIEPTKERSRWRSYFSTCRCRRTDSSPVWATASGTATGWRRERRLERRLDPEGLVRDGQLAWLRARAGRGRARSG